MKKGMLLLALIAALLLALCAQGALAEEASVPWPEIDGRTDYVSELCFAGETLYALGDRALYSLAPGADAFEVAVDLTAASAYRWQTRRPDDPQEAALWSQAVSLLAADGDSLLAVQPWSAQVLRLSGGALAVQFDLPQELLAMQDDEDMRREVVDAACQGGELFLLVDAATWEESGCTQLIAVDLATHAVRECSVRGAVSVAAGAPGELLLLTEGGYAARMMGEDGEAKLLRYDIASDSALELASFGDNASVGAMAYDAPAGSPVLLCEGRVVRADAPQTALAYAPASFVYPRTQAACSPAGRYAISTGGYVFLRDVASGNPASKTELTVAGNLDPSLIAAFCAEHPEIAVIPGYAQGGAGTALLTGDPRLDVLEMSVPEGMFTDAAARGYLAEIDSEALRAWVDTLYPAVGEAVTREGRLLGVPIKLMVDSWMLDETMWREAGLGEEPQTYDELFDAVELWLGEKAEDYPDFTLTDLQQMGLSAVVEMIVREYVLEYERPGEVLSFDTDAFRGAMMALARRGDLLSDEQWGMPILYSYNQGFGVSYNDSERMRMALPPSLGGERALTAGLQLLAVSAASQHKAEATLFVSWYAQHLGDVARYEMTPSLTEPVESPAYAPRVAQLEAQIASLEERAENARDEDELRALEEELAWARGVLERSDDMRYSISPEAIAVYRALAQNLRIPINSVLWRDGVSDSLMGVIAPICDDGLTAEEVDVLIAQLGRVLSMAAQEGA